MSQLFKVADHAKEPLASALFIHGLGGHHYDTWRRDTGRKPWNDDDTFWPLWLARDCKALAIYVIGYEAPISRWHGTAMHLTNQATNILARLLAEPTLAHGPLVLVGHSLGGLIIKQLLRTADSMARYDARATDLIERVEKVAFLATPHAGAGLALLGDRLRILVRPSAATASLVRNDPNLQDLNNWYREWANDRGIAHLILTETVPASILGVTVPPDSADPGLANIRSLPIFSDHTGISKPIDDKEDIYVLVRDFVTQPVERAKRLPDIVVEKLLAILDARGETARAADAGIERGTILELARRLKPDEVLDCDQAVAEVRAVVDTAVENIEKGARGSNLGDLVNAVLSAIAAKTRVGDIHGAAREADQGFAEWERAEVERRAFSTRSGVALLEAGLRQDILRRDAVAAAYRVKRIVALEHPDDVGARFEAICERHEAFYERGRDKATNLDLLVAIEIGRLALSSAQNAQQRKVARIALGAALYSSGRRESGTTHLEEAVTVFRDAIEETSREHAPFDWAKAQSNLGAALHSLSERESGTAHLEGAVAAFRAAMEETSRERAPLVWATIQHNLGTALEDLGRRESDTARLEEAVTAFRDALKERNRDRVPLDWAATQSNLGAALHSLGERESSTVHLEEAVRAFRGAIEETTREQMPLRWAANLHGLAGTLSELGERESDTARLEEAVTLFRIALEEQTRERVPLYWAGAQNDLGTTLMRLGERERGTARLEEAIAALRNALEERTRERVPLDWAMTQHNLGTALMRLGERKSSIALLEDAITAFCNALEERTSDRVPLDWAMTQHNLGAALHSIGERESGTARLEEAVTNYRKALKEWTRERIPLAWAATQTNLGSALLQLSERKSDAALLEEAVTAYRDALKERTRDRVPLDWAKSFGNEGVALMRLAERREDIAMAETALGQITTAIETLRNGGDEASAERFETQFAIASAAIAHLHGT